MKAAWRKYTSGWIAVAVCAGVVLLGGTQLMVLSLHQTAAQMRTAAQRLADRDAVTLQAQLQALSALAEQRAAAAAAADAASSQEGRSEFWLGSDGKLLGSPNDYRTASDIATAWSEAASDSSAYMLGPLREGSHWLVALRAPLRLPRGNGGSVPIGWSVVYRDLSELLVAAQLDRVTRAGYDFQLSRIDTAGRTVIFTGSAAAPLADPVASPIALPGNSVDGAPRATWSLAMRPRTGWFPASALAVDVSLLILVTWLVALGVRDGARHFLQLRSALAVSRRRLQDAHRRLAQEIERRDQLQKSFDYAHFHDSFTGLPNRQFFLGKLDRALRELRGRPERSLAVLLIAIDRFKVVTDTLGHTAGDELMLQITREFGQVLAAQEHALARWSEEELALLLPDAADAAAAPDAARALQLALQAPIELRRHRVMVAASIGASFIDSGLRRTEEVMREADIALSTARSRGGGASFALYGASMQANLVELVSVEADLQLALERNEFRLLFQPIVDLRSRRVVGVEALLRWLHPVHGLLTPAHFLGLAEEAGLIVPITHWIIARSCELSRQWRLRLPPGRAFYISINLSPAALLDPDLGAHVDHALNLTGTPAAALKFELTESGLISNAGAARDALDRLHAMGIELMLDDFGTGYSSLSHLQLFPFDYIKIDGPFDASPGLAQGHSTLVRAIAQIAATLGLKTIAEVVETSDAVATLERIGCGYAQGNVFCAPVDAEQAIQRLCEQVLEPMDESARQAFRDELDDAPTMILPAIPETAVS
jgi:diguanylate cyclase (GGDEF)-like protein